MEDQDNTKLFKYLIQGVKDYAIFALDPDGKIITWNAGAERTKGYLASEVIGKHFSMFYTDDAKASGQPQFELKRQCALAAMKKKDGASEKTGANSGRLL